MNEMVKVGIHKSSLQNVIHTMDIDFLGGKGENSLRAHRLR